MKNKKTFQNQKGAAVLLLDILFVAAGIFLLIYSLIREREIGASILGAIFGK